MCPASRQEVPTLREPRLRHYAESFAILTNAPEWLRETLAGKVGLEPTPLRLTAECSTVELLANTVFASYR